MMKFKPVLLSVFLVFSLLIAQPFALAEVQGYEFSRETCNKGLSPSLNVKDSLVMSAVTVCIPGMLEKINEYKQIKCQEVVCSYEALKNGLDPTFCSKQAGYKTCRYITGEVFAFPIANFFESIRDGIAQYLSNPYSAVVKGARMAASRCSGACDGVVWTGTSLFLAVNDLAAFAQRIKNLIENGFSGLSSSKNYCDDVPDIKDEVDDILEATK